MKLTIPEARHTLNPPPLLAAARLAWVMGVLFLAPLSATSSTARFDDDGLAQELASAQADYERGDFFGASELLTELVQEESGYDPAKILLLRVSVEMGEFTRAEAIDQDLATREGDDVTTELLLARGDYAFTRGRIALAEELARRAIELDARDLHGHFQLARARWEQGDRKGAREIVTAAAAIHVPRTLDADGLLDLARLYQVASTADDIERAAQCCVYAEKKRLEAGRPTTDVLVLLGDLYLQAKSLTGSTPRAFKTYRDALDQNASLVAAKVGRAWTHLYVYDSFDAEKEIEEALLINARSVEALTVKAWIAVMDGRYGDALELLDRALEVNPSAKKARSVRGAALYLSRRQDEYEQEVAKVLELDPTYGEFFWTVGDALSQLLRFGEAVGFHRRAIELDPELPLAEISLARDLGYVGKEEEARSALTRSLETHPFPHPWRHNMLLLMKKFDSEYVDEASEHFVFRLQVDENPILGERLKSVFEKDLEYLSNRYEWKPDESVLIEMFPAHQDFSVRSVGMIGLGAVGACFGDFVTLVSPRSEMRHGFVWRRTALHELAHVMTLGRSKGRVPRWLTEGLSVYEERCARSTWGRDLELDLYNAWYNDEVIPLETFNASFRGPRIAFAYYQGGLFCEFVTARYGFDHILAMLDAYGEDLEVTAVMRRVFEKTPAELDAEFLDYLYETYLRDVRVQPTIGEPKKRKLRVALRKDGENPDLLAELAWAYYQTGKEVDADVQLDRALRASPDHPVARRLAAHRALDRRRPDLAKKHLEVAFANGGEEYFSALVLAMILTREKEFDAAQDALKIAKRCFPYDIGPGNPHLALKEILMSEGDLAGAMEELKLHVDRLETDLKGRLELATWYQSTGNYAEAYRYASEAEDIDPFVQSVYIAQGDALLEMMEYAKAIQAFRSALQVDPRLEPGYSPAPDGDAGAEAEAANRLERAEIFVKIADIELTVGDRAACARDLASALQLAPGLESALELKQRLDS